MKRKTNTTASRLVGLAAAIALATPAWAAQPVAITNAGFEDPILADGAWQETIPGWSPGRYNVSNPGVWIPGPSDAGVYNVSTAEYTSGLAPEGENMGYATTLAGFETGINQVLTSTLQADATYVLTVKIGNPALYNEGTTADYRVELLAGGVLLDSATGPSPVDDTEFITATITYNSGAAPAQLGQPLEIRLLALDFASGYEVDFDDVKLTVALANPVANPGGPYLVAIPDGSLSLDGSGSLPSDSGTTITAWEWDLNINDNGGAFNADVTGATPAAIDYATLTAAPPAGFGMAEGDNTIKLRVTDDSSPAKTSIAETIVTLAEPSATLTWDHNADGTASDGNGIWLNANQWLDGANPATWDNAAPNNAIIGSGGAGGTITVGDVTAGSVLIDKFSGAYTLQGTGTTLTQSDGIMIGPDAGNVTLRGTGGTTSRLWITGDGGITMNGSGVLISWQNLVLTYTGPTVVNSGVMMFYNNLPTGSNFTLNNGMLTDYYRQTHIFANGLGTGAGQIQIYGNSGFGSGNGNGNWRIGAQNSVLQWGSTYFNPSTLKLRAPADNNGPSIYGQVTLQNGLDLNGGVRTIDVLAGTGANAPLNAWGNIAGAIVDNSVGGGGSLIKTGGGILRLSGANTYTGGTTVENGILTINGSLADSTMLIKPGATVNGTGTLNFNASGATIDQIVMTGGTLNAAGLTVNASGSMTASEYVIVDATAGGTISGTFAGLTGAPGYALDYGTANQVKLVGPGTTSPYDSWATGGELFDGDANGDGVSNGLAFLLGAANPGEDALGLLPAVTETGGGLVLTFSMLNAANRGPATLSVQHSNDLGVTDLWSTNTALVPETSSTVNDVVFVITPNGTTNDVVATIPASKASAGKLFGRLEAANP